MAALLHFINARLSSLDCWAAVFDSRCEQKCRLHEITCTTMSNAAKSCYNHTRLQPEQLSLPNTLSDRARGGNYAALKCSSNQSAAIWATCSSVPGSSKRYVAPGMRRSSFGQVILAMALRFISMTAVSSD